MNILNYIDRLEKKIEYFSPTGDGTLEEYQKVLDKKTGDFNLVCVGKINTDEKIQAFAESADISNIINRFMNGETDLLNQVDGAYVDVTNAPTSYAEYFNKVREAKKIFDQLPDDIKVKFDNDPEKFFLEFGTDSFVDKVSDQVVVSETEVIREEFDNAE